MNKPTVAKAKNECGKMRPVENPYEVWTNAQGWTWKVLKKWQTDDNKPYARWFCAVSSPFTFGGYDMGDVYVSEIKAYATKVSDKPCTLVDYLDGQGIKYAVIKPNTEPMTLKELEGIIEGIKPKEATN